MTKFPIFIESGIDWIHIVQPGDPIRFRGRYQSRSGFLSSVVGEEGDLHPLS